MTQPKDAERMRKAEEEVGENIPDQMIGLDTEDVGDVAVQRGGRSAERESVEAESVEAESVEAESVEGESVEGDEAGSRER